MFALQGRKQFSLLACVSVFMVALAISAITASKLIEVSLFGLHVVLPVGTSLFAITFLSTDCISEIWGKRTAFYTVAIGFFMRIFVLCFLAYAVWLTPASFWPNQEAYDLILSNSSSILIAGIVTYPISQSVDIIIFHYLKKRQAGKNMLWLRNNLSTFCSQFVDSACFTVIAFGGSNSSDVLIKIILGQMAVKWIVALCDTPFVYLVRNFVENRRWNDVSG